LQIWRIRSFHVIPVSPSDYGTFYDGDSYIVLHTRGHQRSPAWDLHFWLGEHTSVDEAGTAAYKTVELDDKFGGVPTQHREVQGFESQQFLSYFPKSLRILTGGFESGFHHVGPTEYRHRLLHVKGKHHFICEEVSLHASSLNSGDTFILDGGLQIYVWQGKESSPIERVKAEEVANATRDERDCHSHIDVVEEGTEPDEFWALLGGKGHIASAAEGGDDFASEKQNTKVLMKLSDASGSMTFTQVSSGTGVRRDQLSSDAVFVFDTGAEVFVWVGKRSDVEERSKSLVYAQEYLKQHNRPPYISIAKVFEGGENEVFYSAFH